MFSPFAAVEAVVAGEEQVGAQEQVGDVAEVVEQGFGVGELFMIGLPGKAIEALLGALSFIFRGGGFGDGSGAEVLADDATVVAVGTVVVAVTVVYFPAYG